MGIWLGLLALLMAANANAAAIVVADDDTLGDRLSYCYDEPFNESYVRFKVTFFATGSAGNFTLWRLQQRQDCDQAHDGSVKAEPMALGLQDYQFELDDVTEPRSLTLKLKYPGMAEYNQTQIWLRNLAYD